MTRVILAIAVALVAAGCAAQADVPLACANLCDCSVASPIGEEQCTELCIDVLGQSPASQECLNCAAFSSCDELGGLEPSCELECGDPVESLLLETTR